MTKIKLIIASFVLLFGFFGGYKIGSYKYNQLLINIQKSHIKNLEAEQKKSNEYKAISQSYYEAYLTASDVINDAIDARVFIKATCPTLPTAGSGSVGDATDNQRAELHPATTKRITAVTNQATADVLKCKAQLSSLQEKILLFNKGK